MSTFSGDYVREPSDFLTVTTELGLIQIADDPRDPIVADDVDAWADLTIQEAAELIATINTIAVRKEGVVNGILINAGFVTPIDPATDTLVVDYAIRLVWNDLLLRKQQITRDEYRAENSTVLSELKIAAAGFVSGVGATPAESPTSIVSAVGGSARVFSREDLEEF